METPNPDAVPSSSEGSVASACDQPHCSRCDAVCCRLTVVVMPEDRVPSHLLDTRNGLTVMAHDEEGWCVALDSARMCCSIYESRPEVCRRFVMGGPYCRSVREEYSERRALGIELVSY
jgi:Fe-S-cluster containining protein